MNERVVLINPAMSGKTRSCMLETVISLSKRAVASYMYDFACRGPTCAFDRARAVNGEPWTARCRYMEKAGGRDVRKRMEKSPLKKP